MRKTTELSAVPGSVTPGTDPAPGSDTVIPGAGPVPRPGERATVRLRAGGPGEPPSRHAPGEPSRHAPEEPSRRAPEETPAEYTPEEPSRYAPEWLRLRETADAAARATELIEPLRTRLADRADPHGGLVVHDLGCGTGSMGRWLAPRLDGAQHWILHDRDPYLLHFAAVGAADAAADGSRITVETRRGDVARLTPDALAGASLVTASALLDVLTRDDVAALAAACAGAGCPALLTLSVVGRVELTPADPLDAELTEAFNAHQRRNGLLGPDAVTAACEAFAARGVTVRVCPSPWRLGPDQRELTAQWLRGWVGAAVELRPELRPRADRFLAERLEACAAGELRAVVHHSDLLALPGPRGGDA
ncbi:methyltransferase domain-containing protein [Streptomyces spiralis]